MSIFEDTVSFADRGDKEKVYGVVIGIVTANADPSHAYRVKVRLPHIPGGGETDKSQDSTHWARISSILAGEYIGDDHGHGPRGAYFMPEIGDEVLVVFAYGDVSNPVIIGRLWSDVGPTPAQGGGKDSGKPNKPVYAHTQAKGVLAHAVDDDPKIKIHAKTKHEAKKNDLSGMRTRSGHMLVFNDNKQEQAIYLRSAKQHRIELVDGGNQGILIADPHDNYIWLKSGAAAADGDIEIKTAGNIKLDAGKSIILHATENIETTSDGYTKMTSTKTYTIKAGGDLKVSTDHSGSISATQTLEITGKPIHLNRN